MSGHGRPEGEQQENAERWLITYADMITLLMAFFIMMYSMSVVDLQKFEALAHAMGTAFGAGSPEAAAARAAGAGLLGQGETVAGRGMGALPGSGGNRATLVNRLRRELGRALPEGLGDAVEVIHCGGTVTVRLRADAVSFAAGSTQLTADAQAILDAIGPALRDAGTPLRVEGHTCDLPIATARFPSNWELSAQRAANVMAYLVRTAGIRAEEISAAGFADTHPLAPNRSEAARRRNRRVDIVIDAARPGGARDAALEDPARAVTTIHLPTIRLCPPIDLEARHRDHASRPRPRAPRTR